MKMKVSKILCGVCAASLTLWAFAAEPWEDPAVNAINRMPARTYSMPLADEAAALTDALEPETPYKKTLNGDWKFAWAGNPDLRVKDFWKSDFDDSNWFTIDVPSCVEMRGFGSPGYTNQRYPHADLSHPTNANFAAIRDRDTLRPDYNPVSSYRTTFTVPAGWAGRDVILRFDGVYSAYYVWVNGHRVGYAEDSCLPSEFDITPYLNVPNSQTPKHPNIQTDNVLCVEVYRWCDGSYLEDQDMFRFSGIFRDVTLWAKPKGGIWDFTVKTELASDFQSATLTLVGLSGDWSATLYDVARKPVATLSSDAATARLAPVALWSAETPNLYTLVIRKGDDIRMKRVGFKRQEIRGNAFYVNGRKVKLKGVNRHETDPANGRTVSLDSMVRDIELFKRFNIDTVRTSHYPDHHLWYDLCDRYGIYVVAEANVEGHEPQYGDRGLGRFAEWEPSIVERNVRQVICYRDNVSVTMWSVGNETGHGRCFSAALKAVKALDPGRLTHWERGNREADVDSQMYPSVDWVVKRGRLGEEPLGSRREMPSWTGGAGEEVAQTAGKPAFLCEYAHAMGNAVGNLQEYWDAIYAYDALMGGCIWDWADQAVWKATETGRYLAYGGDFDEEPNDGPFCCNGLVGPFRKVSAKLAEVGHVYRNLVVTRNAAGSFVIENRFGFLDAATFEGLWRIRQDGRVVSEGTFAVPPVAPLSRAVWADSAVSARLRDLKGRGEVFLDVDFALKGDTCWAKKGWLVSRNQIAIGSGWNFARDEKCPVAPSNALPGEGSSVAPSGVTIDEGEKAVTVTAGATKAVFCRASGTLCELVMDGRTILKGAGGGTYGPRLTCERAYTDNDRWMQQGSNWGPDRRRGSVLSCGLSQLRYHARPFKALRDGLEIVTDVTGSKSAGFTHRAVWRFDAHGTVEIENEVTPHGTMPPALPRLGLSLVLDAALENVAYYGRGPHENYVDRCTGSFFGIWTNTVTGLSENYVRPQDNGYRTGVRWLSLTDADGKGVRFSASEPLFVQALHFAREDLEFARHRRGEPRVRAALMPRPEVFLNLDVRQTGLGEASCGPEPLPQYRFDPNAPVSWRLFLSPRGWQGRASRQQ